MTPVELQHADMVLNLAKPGLNIVHEMNPVKAHLAHMTMGVAGEAGELLDAVKKHVIYGKPLDVANVLEEMGDLEFYLQGLRSCLGVSRDQILLNNIEKLSKRYASGKYSDTQAQARADKHEAARANAGY